MKNIYLVGFMGAGKTSVGKILASKLAKKFIETDEVIERQEGKKIKDIFAGKGELYFRRLESNLLNELSSQRDLVVSCGGGLVCSQKNLELLQKSGYLFSLLVSPALAYQRVKGSDCRPLLNVKDPLAEIKKLIELREPYYQKPKNKIDTDKLTPEEVADSILGLLDNG